jgi:hypothetical protein
MERMAEVVPHSDDQVLQHFLTNSTWNDQLVIESFRAGLFEPFDDVSIAMPFNAETIEELAGSKGILLYEDSRTYSGVVIGIKKQAPAKKR